MNLHRYLIFSLLALLATMGAGCVESAPTPIPAPTARATPAFALTPTSTVSRVSGDTTRTPTAGPTPTSSGTLASDESPLPLTLSAAEAQGLTHPGIRSAIANLQQLVGEELDLIQILRADQVTWSDSSLG